MELVTNTAGSKVSARYQTVHTAEIIRGLSERELIIPGTVKRIANHRNTKEMIRADVYSDQLLLMGDAVKPQLLLWNSYEGESSFVAKLGFFRFVCSNGMAVGDVVAGVKLRHVRGPKFDAEFSQFFDRLEILMQDGFKQLEQRLSRHVDDSKLDAALVAITSAKSVQEQIKQTFLEPRRREDSGRNVWALWNVAQEIMQKRSRSPIAFEVRNQVLLSKILGVVEKVAA